jgi:hypothetical protein
MEFLQVFDLLANLILEKVLSIIQIVYIVYISEIMHEKVVGYFVVNTYRLTEHVLEHYKWRY